MIGMSCTTGRTVTDRAHLAQSIADILTTPWAAESCAASTAANWPT